ncbi:hypothetical protein OJ252_3164 [Cryptosporidium canis]|uniref:Signal peptide-containing protein n=1 Tax=Cryptosporidium canis TaxID=195482 RepID=A0ABQ8P363_9CRYT|nr:hypothetical protein OJ252_3164 [Cryptosporidium canis]
MSINKLSIFFAIFVLFFLLSGGPSGQEDTTKVYVQSSLLNLKNGKKKNGKKDGKKLRPCLKKPKDDSKGGSDPLLCLKRKKNKKEKHVRFAPGTKDDPEEDTDKFSTLTLYQSPYWDDDDDDPAEIEIML